MSERLSSMESFNDIPDVRKVFDIEKIDSPFLLAQSLHGLAGRLSGLSDQSQIFSKFIKHGNREERLKLEFNSFVPEEEDNYIEILKKPFRVQKSNHEYLKLLDSLPINEIITILHSWALELDPNIEQRILDLE